MANYPGNIPSGSHSPEDRLRPYTTTPSKSPHARDLNLLAPGDEYDPTVNRPGSRGSYLTPADESDSTAPPLSRAGGCWTCRLRRKKCDEQRRDGSCATCLRLKIECLGWGPQKPEWMKDKDQVELYKAQIKAQLMRAGRIRGQPKPSTKQGTPTRPSLAGRRASAPQVPTKSLTTSSMGSDLLLPPRIGGDDGPYGDYGFDSSSASVSPMVPLTDGRSNRRSRSSSSYHPYAVRRSDGPCYSVPPLPNGLSPYTDNLEYPTVRTQSYPDLQPLPLPNYSSSDPSLSGAMGPLSPNVNDTIYVGDVAPSPALSSTGSPHQAMWQPAPLKASQEALVLYFFKHVLQYQFPLTDGTVIDTVHEVVVNQPDGPFAYAICSVAGLHASRTGLGMELGVDPTAIEQIPDFFNGAYWQLSERRQYSESDALAAWQLLAYLVLAGGIGDWRAPLNMACHWLETSVIGTLPNPASSLLHSSSLTKFAFASVMWVDAFSGISLRSTPRCLRLYQSVLRSGGANWTGQQNSDAYHPHLEGLMGCPDDVVLAWAEIADLESWKIQQQQNGTLSFQELVNRANFIGARLRSPGRPASTSLLDPHATPGASPRSASTSSPASLEHTPSHYQPGLTPDTNDANSRIADVLRNGALVYLYTVINGHYPNVPETRDAVQSVISTLKSMPITLTERALILPIFLAGTLVDSPSDREFFRNRISVQNPHIGNVGQALKLMEAVWGRRDIQGGVGGIDWRDVMSDGGYCLLLV